MLNLYDMIVPSTLCLINNSLFDIFIWKNVIDFALSIYNSGDIIFNYKQVCDGPQFKSIL